MLTPVADGVLVHQSELLRNNTVVVRGESGVLIVDPGLTTGEMGCLAEDLRQLGQPVVAGFATHPDWDHALWHADLGDVPRYGTARCSAYLRELRSEEGWQARVAEGLPPEIADETPLELFGLIVGLPAGAELIPWNGPEVRVIEHPAHAPGHAALLVEDRGVLVAGDMLSDLFVPMLDDTEHPVVHPLPAGLDRRPEPRVVRSAAVPQRVQILPVPADPHLDLIGRGDGSVPRHEHFDVVRHLLQEP